MRPSRRTLLLGAGTFACNRPSGGYQGYAFVANEESRSVAAVHLSRFTVERRIPIDSSPTAVIAHPTRPAVYVFTPHTGTVHELEISGLAIRRKVRIAPSAQSMRLAPDNGCLWVLCRDARVLVRLDLDRFEPTSHIRLPAAAQDFDLAAYFGRAAVSFPAERAVAIITLETGNVEHLVPVGPDPRTLRFRSDGRQVIVGNCGDRTLSVIDAISGRAIVRLPLAVEPATFCFKHDGGGLYVSGPGMDAIVSVYPYQTMVDATLLAGRSPGAMAVTTSPPYTLFVANTLSGDVTVFDIETSKVIAVMQVGLEPSHIAITEDDQFALVLNRKSGDMAVIRVPAVRRARGRGVSPPLLTLIPVGAKPVSAAVRTV